MGTETRTVVADTPRHSQMAAETDTIRPCEPKLSLALSQRPSYIRTFTPIHQTVRLALSMSPQRLPSSPPPSPIQPTCRYLQRRHLLAQQLFSGSSWSRMLLRLRSRSSWLY